MERDPKDSKITFAEFSGSDIEVSTIEDANLVLAVLGDAAVSLSQQFGYQVYPVLRLKT